MRKILMKVLTYYTLFIPKVLPSFHASLEKVAEHYLRRSDKRNVEFVGDPQVMNELAKVRQAIEHALEDTEFFHGTGRKHYGFEGESQYDGIGSSSGD